MWSNVGWVTTTGSSGVPDPVEGVGKTGVLLVTLFSGNRKPEKGERLLFLFRHSPILSFVYLQWSK